MTNTLIPAKVTPSDDQVRLVVDAIEGWPSATLFPSMDEDGTMLLGIEEDGFLTHARFDRSGRLQGDWF